MIFLTGVLQVEALAQLGGILMLEGASEAAKGNFFFGGVDSCRFRKPVVPGDTLVGRTCSTSVLVFARLQGISISVPCHDTYVQDT